MNNEQIEDLVDLMFNTDMEEVMKEKSTLEYIHILQQENKELKRMCELYSKSLYNADLTKANQKINKAIKYIKFEWQEIIGNENYSNHLWTIDGLVIKRLLEILGGKE